MTSPSHLPKNIFQQFFNAILIILFIIIFTSSICYGQSGLYWFNDTTWGSTFMPYAVNYDGTVLVGQVNVFTDDGYGTKAIRWDITNGYQLLGDLGGTGFVPYGGATGVSADGNIVVGACKSSASSQVGFRWQKETGMIALPNGGSVYCTIAGVDSTGTIIAGHYSDPITGHNDPVRWVNGSMEILYNGLSNGNSVKGISIDGSVIVGDASYFCGPCGSQEPEAVEWLNGVATVLPFAPGALATSGYSTSRNGDVIVGRMSNYIGYGAFRYTASGGMVDLGLGSNVQPGGGISADGKMFIGSVIQGGKYSAVVWYGTNTAPQDLKTKCKDDFGINVGNYTLRRALCISGDRSTIIGEGYDSLDQLKIFRLVLPRNIIVRSPAASEISIGGLQDTLRWETPFGVDSVDIYYSLDSGKTRILVTKDYKANLDSLLWNVPDTVSQDFKIIIMASNDTTIRGESPIFTIRGYWLLRTNPMTNRYELFDISLHGWQFSNTTNIMWPASWWGGFVYPNGQDPYTHAVYPDRDPFKHAKASDFIDWRLFVRTMGEQNCYYFFAGNNTTIYRGAAESFWESQKEKWGGSCYGFAISTLMAFGMAVEFKNTFPEMPAFNDPPNRYLLSGIADTDSTRMVINSLYFSQNGKQHATYFENKSRSTTPKQTLAELREMLMSDTRDDKSLSLVPQNHKGGHEIVAYRVTNDPPGSSKFRLYVDDSNIPTDKNAFVEVDTTADTWTYSRLTNSAGAAWTGSKGLTLDDPVSLYTQLPILPKGISSLPTRYKSVFLAEDSTWDVYLPSQADVMITDNEGRSLGVVGDTMKWEIPDAVPIKPGTITSAPPGYTLPKGEYSVTVGPFRDTTAVVKLFTDAMIYAYRRYGVDSLQVDRFHLGPHGLMVKNTDASEKKFDLEAIIPLQNDSGEYRVLLSGLTAGSGDSVRFTIDSLSIPVIRNYGSHPTAYDIILLEYHYMEGVGYAQQKFLHQSVIVDPNSTHTIRPAWNDLSHKSLEITIDLGNDGTIDSTLNIADQTLGVGGNGSNEIPQSYGLMQNHPNPFNPSTDIGFQLPEAANVRIVVYDLLGQQIAVVADGNYTVGAHHVSFDGSELTSGIYFYRIVANNFIQTKKMVLTK